MEKLKSTKFIVTVLTVLVGLAAVLIKEDIPPNFLSLLEYVISAFVAGNVAAGAVGAYAAVKATTPAPVEVAVVEDDPRIDQLLAATQATQSGVAAIIQRMSPQQ